MRAAVVQDVRGEGGMPVGVRTSARRHGVANLRAL